MLRESYTPLEKDYEALKLKYGSLRKNYEELEEENRNLSSKVNTLTEDYDKLRSKFETTIRLLEAEEKELDTYKALSYIFTITTVALSATTIYLIADTKYRELRRLNVEDIERIIAYIIDYSEPQDHEEIKGFLITLDGGQPHGVIERTDITPSIRIYHLSADPRQRDVALSALEEVYSKIFKAN